MHGITWSALRQKFVQMYAAFASRFVFSFLRVATQVNALNFSEPDRWQWLEKWWVFSGYMITLLSIVQVCGALDLLLLVVSANSVSFQDLNVMVFLLFSDESFRIRPDSKSQGLFFLLSIQYFNLFTTWVIVMQSRNNKAVGLSHCSLLFS